jgi:hypothetical protein
VYPSGIGALTLGRKKEKKKKKKEKKKNPLFLSRVRFSGEVSLYFISLFNYTYIYLFWTLCVCLFFWYKPNLAQLQRLTPWRTCHYTVGLKKDTNCPVCPFKETNVFPFTIANSCDAQLSLHSYAISINLCLPKF